MDRMFAGAYTIDGTGDAKAVLELHPQGDLVRWADAHARIAELEAQRNGLSTALGVLTTIADVEVDVLDPVSMALEIEAKVRARIAELEADLAAMTSRYSRSATDIASLEAEIDEAREEIRVDDSLLAERDRLLDKIPECPDHGRGCVPGAIEWIESVKAQLAEAREDCGFLLDVFQVWHYELGKRERQRVNKIRAAIDAARGEESK